MSLEPLFRNDAFMRKLYALTLQQLSATEMQELIRSENIVSEKVTSSKITNLWRRYGGKESFCTVMQRRDADGIPLAEPAPAEKEPLLSEAELQKLAKLARKVPWSHAIAQSRSGGPSLSEMQVRGYLQRTFGSLTGFFEKYKG